VVTRPGRGIAIHLDKIAGRYYDYPWLGGLQESYFTREDFDATDWMLVEEPVELHACGDPDCVVPRPAPYKKRPSGPPRKSPKGL